MNKTHPPSPTAPPGDLSLQHLLAELRAVDTRVQRAVRLWQLAGQNPLDAFRGLYVSDPEAQALIERPFGQNWGAHTHLSSEDSAAFEVEYRQARREADALLAQASGQGQVPRLEHLARSFGLERFDLDVLLIALAPALDLRYERLYGYLQDDVTRKRPAVNLALDLLSLPGPQRLAMLERFSDSAPLFKYHLLERFTEPGAARPPLLAQSLAVEDGLLHWLVGSAAGPSASMYAFPGDEMLASEHIASLLDGAQIDGPDLPPLVIFSGLDQAAQDAAARLLAARLEQPLLPMRMLLPGQAAGESLDRLRLALRDCRLLNAIPYLTSWDAPDIPTEEAAALRATQAVLLAEVLSFPGLAILSGRASWRAQGLQRSRRLLHAGFDIPAAAQRLDIWRSQLTEASTANPYLQTAADLDRVAGQFRLVSGQIRDAMAMALDLAAEQNAPLETGHLLAAARAQSSQMLNTLARKITPRYTPADIILPKDQVRLLGEIIDTIRARPLVLETWGVGQKLVSSSGVTILFAGPPGTGKTMAAEIIAAEIGLDLYKIDLSTVISKYIGETEKNLERIFVEADSSNAILFFDEADAIFGKRSEVRDSHDRYANVEISYLLQRMEAYNGVTILATNLRANLDEAFTRRLQFSVDFPFPEEADRLRIWQTLFPAGVPRDDDIDLVLLARRFRLAGGSIRNILVGAAYLAASDGGRVHMAHLLHSTRRELQKMGRLVGEEDMRVKDQTEEVP
jgi:hypothetical protein